MIATKERKEQWKFNPEPYVPSFALSKAARERMLSRRGEPLFFADWMRVLMIHLKVDAQQLQRDVPYQVDLHDGKAFVTLVAFTMENMRPRFGGKLSAWLFKLIATHDFLNVRTYVRHQGEPGIHFLTEWLSNRLAAQLGPRTFSLPYRHGRITYEHDFDANQLRGRVTDVSTGAEYSYQAGSETSAQFAPCATGSFDEWLMERYTAFNCASGQRKFFRVWHPPWLPCPVSVEFLDLSLLQKNWRCFRDAKLVGVNFSLGLQNVWMGRPHRLD